MRPSATSVLVGLVLLSQLASADPYDLRVYKLGNPNSSGTGYDPAANANFREFAREFGAALTSANLTPPETLGHAGFAINAELSIVNFADSVVIPTEQFTADREGISGALLIPSVHVRKGLPWSFELGTRVGWIEKSKMAAATGELKWALNEGFTYLPDLAARAHITKLLNTKDFDLTTGGLDIGLGKQFPIGGMVTLTPYVGWNLVWVAASANTIDFDPGRDYNQSISTPNEQFSNTAVFNEVTWSSNSHNRFYGGLRFIGGTLQLGAEYSVSQLPRIAVPTGNGDETVQRELPNLTALNFTVGLDY